MVRGVSIFPHLAHIDSTFTFIKEADRSAPADE